MDDLPPPFLGRRSRARRGVGLPVVYACSGCSGPGQMVNHVAVQLAQRGLARMGCVAALGADVPAMIEAAVAAPHVIALDGCAVACTTRCLARHRITPDQHYVAAPGGIPDESFERAEAEHLIGRVLADLLRPVQGAT